MPTSAFIMVSFVIFQVSETYFTPIRNAWRHLAVNTKSTPCIKQNKKKNIYSFYPHVCLKCPLNLLIIQTIISRFINNYMCQ